MFLDLPMERPAEPRRHRSRMAAAAFILFVGWRAAAAGRPSAADYRRSGEDHFFNLEYDAAIADYMRATEEDPNDPTIYNSLAGAYLYREMHRLGMLETSAFRGDNQFLRQKPPSPDPRTRLLFEDALNRGRRVAEALLAKDPKNQLALYALGAGYALEGNYEFSIEKAWFAALRHGSKAREYCDQVRKLNPNFVDAYLVLGVYEYVMGSLPLPVKLVVALGGLHGDRAKGEALLARVAKEGNYSRNDARVLLVILYRRERRPLEAAHMLEGLLADFPRNYVLQLELGSMYAEAGEASRAVATFRDALQKSKANAPGFEHLPREAVVRKIERLEGDAKTAAGSPL